MDAPPLLGFGFLSKRQTPIFRELWGSGLGYRRPEAAINRNLAPILRPSKPVPEKQKNHLPPTIFLHSFYHRDPSLALVPKWCPWLFLWLCLNSSFYTSMPQYGYQTASLHWMIPLRTLMSENVRGEGANDLFQPFVQTPFPGDGRTQTSRHFECSSYSSCRPSLSQRSLEQHQEAKLAP